MLEGEDYMNYSPLIDRMEQYYFCQVWESFHLSFDEFINRPRHEVELILDLAQKFMKHREVKTPLIPKE